MNLARDDILSPSDGLHDDNTAIAAPNVETVPRPTTRSSTAGAEATRPSQRTTRTSSSDIPSDTSQRRRSMSFQPYGPGPTEHTTTQSPDESERPPPSERDEDDEFFSSKGSSQGDEQELPDLKPFAKANPGFQYTSDKKSSDAGSGMANFFLSSERANPLPQHEAVGTGVVALSMIFTALFPIQWFARRLHTQKESITTYSQLADSLDASQSAATAILKHTSKILLTSKLQTHLALDLFLAHDVSLTATSLICVVLLWIINHPQSPKKDHAKLVVLSYFFCADADLKEWRKKASSGRSVPTVLAETVPLVSTPGHLRLTPGAVINEEGQPTHMTNAQYFFNLKDLLDTVIAALCYHRTDGSEVSTAKKKLIFDPTVTPTHHLMMKSKESVVDFNARHALAYFEFKLVCQAVMEISKLPSEEDLAHNMFRAAKAILQSWVADHHCLLNIQGKRPELNTRSGVFDSLLLAETAISDVPAIYATVATSQKQRTPAPAAPDAVKPAPGAKPQARDHERIYPVSATKAEKYQYKQKSLELAQAFATKLKVACVALLGVIGSATIPRPAGSPAIDIDQAFKDGACLNCMSCTVEGVAAASVPRHLLVPAHRKQNCCFNQANGKPWDPSHQPVKFLYDKATGQPVCMTTINGTATPLTPSNPVVLVAPSPEVDPKWIIVDELPEASVRQPSLSGPFTANGPSQSTGGVSLACTAVAAPTHNFQILVSSSPCITIDTDAMESILSIKKKIHEKTAIPPIHQSLSFATKHLDDNMPVWSTQIVAGCMIHLTIPGVGGAKEDRPAPSQQEPPEQSPPVALESDRSHQPAHRPTVDDAPGGRQADKRVFQSYEDDDAKQEEVQAAEAIEAVAALIRQESQAGLFAPPQPVEPPSTRSAPDATPLYADYHHHVDESVGNPSLLLIDEHLCDSQFYGEPPSFVPASFPVIPASLLFSLPDTASPPVTVPTATSPLMADDIPATTSPPEIFGMYGPDPEDQPVVPPAADAVLFNQEKDETCYNTCDRSQCEWKCSHGKWCECWCWERSKAKAARAAHAAAAKAEESAQASMDAAGEAQAAAVAEATEQENVCAVFHAIAASEGSPPEEVNDPTGTTPAVAHSEKSPAVVSAGINTVHPQHRPSAEQDRRCSSHLCYYRFDPNTNACECGLPVLSHKSRRQMMIQEHRKTTAAAAAVKAAEAHAASKNKLEAARAALAEAEDKVVRCANDLQHPNENGRAPYVNRKKTNDPTWQGYPHFRCYPSESNEQGGCSGNSPVIPPARGRPPTKSGAPERAKSSPPAPINSVSSKPRSRSVATAADRLPAAGNPVPPVSDPTARVAAAVNPSESPSTNQLCSDNSARFRDSQLRPWRDETTITHLRPFENPETGGNMVPIEPLDSHNRLSQDPLGTSDPSSAWSEIPYVYVGRRPTQHDNGDDVDPLTFPHGGARILDIPRLLCPPPSDWTRGRVEFHLEFQITDPVGFDADGFRNTCVISGEYAPALHGSNDLRTTVVIYKLHKYANPCSITPDTLPHIIYEDLGAIQRINIIEALAIELNSMCPHLILLTDLQIDPVLQAPDLYRTRDQGDDASVWSIYDSSVLLSMALMRNESTLHGIIPPDFDIMDLFPSCADDASRHICRIIEALNTCGYELRIATRRADDTYFEFASSSEHDEDDCDTAPSPEHDQTDGSQAQPLALPSPPSGQQSASKKRQRDADSSKRSKAHNACSTSLHSSPSALLSAWYSVWMMLQVLTIYLFAALPTTAAAKKCGSSRAQHWELSSWWDTHSTVHQDKSSWKRPIRWICIATVAFLLMMLSIDLCTPPEDRLPVHTTSHLWMALPSHGSLTRSPICISMMAPAPDSGNDRSVGTIICFIKDKPWVVGLDSLSDFTLISEEHVDSTWPSGPSGPQTMHGVGSSDEISATTSRGTVMVPIRIQWDSPATWVEAHIHDLPPGLDLVIGVKDLDKFDTKFDRKNWRVAMTNLGLVIPLQTIDEANARLSLRPIKVFSACSGGSFAYSSMRNLGFQISTWTAVEIDPVTRKLARSIVPSDALRHVSPTDIKQLATSAHPFLAEHYDVYLDTCPCKPWSSLRYKPAGFNDARADAMVASMNILALLRKTNPNISVIAENVVPHKDLQADVATMEQGWGVEAREVNAKSWGSSSSRPRNIFTNIVDCAAIPTTEPAPYSWILDSDHYIRTPWFPCIVASEKTRTPPTKTDKNTGVDSPLSIEESERCQGFQPGITDVTGLDLTDSQRLDIVGNALNTVFILNIMRYFAPHGSAYPPVSLSAVSSATHPPAKNTNLPLSPPPPSIDHMTSEELELFLEAKTDADLDAWGLLRCGDFKPPKMPLELKSGQQPLAKHKACYPIKNPIHREGMRLALKANCEAGFMQKVKFRQEFFVSQGFCKAKDDCYPGTDIPRVRLLGDFRALNCALKEPPWHWRNLTSAIDDIASGIPLGSCFYKSYDLKDAFHQCPLTEEAMNLVVVNYDDDYYQYLGAAQGIAISAIFFQPHISACFDRILGNHWRHMYAGYVDDYATFGTTKRQVLRRDRVFQMIMRLFNKQFSTNKADHPDADEDGITTELDLAGLRFTSKGVRINDEYLTLLRFTLKEFSVKSSKDVQHLVGTINYAHTAFEWDRTSKIRYAELIDTIRSAAATVTRPRLCWGPDQVLACSELLDHITTRPLAFSSPTHLVDCQHCLAAMTDASDTAISITLFLVNTANANDVTFEMLQDPLQSALISVKCNILKPPQQRWCTFESEFFAFVRVIECWGSLITRCINRYPLEGPPKFILMGDSTTSISQWTSIHLPTEVDTLSAKARRFFSWSDICAVTQYWPMVTRHIPGDDNHIAHTFSHLGDLCLQRRAELSSPAVKICAVVTLHSYHGKIDSPTSDTIPKGHIVQHLQMSTKDAEIVSAAYKQDMALFHGVTISEIHSVINPNPAQRPHDVPNLHREKITPWAGTQFFALEVPGCGVKLLYTPASCQVLSWGTTSSIDFSRTLVPVIPAGAMVQISALEPIVAAADSVPANETHPVPPGMRFGGDTQHYMLHDLRRDIVLCCHDIADHPSRSNTMSNVRQLAWWPGMAAYVKYHCDSCSHCIPKRAQLATIGASVMAADRFGVIQIDHKILDSDMALSTGFYAVLSIIDCSTRETVMVPCKSVQPVEAALAIYTQWYPTRGIPHVIRSDKHGAFASDTFAAFRQLFGVRVWDCSAPNNPTHHSLVENKHKILQDQLIQGKEKGDLNANSLAIYVASAVGRINLESNSNGTTAMERVTGQRPRTRIDALQQIPTKSEFNIPADQHGGCDNRDFISHINTVTQENNTWEMMVRDEQSRSGILVRTNTLAKSQSQLTDLQENDEVSYNGKAHVIINVIKTASQAPAKCTIRKCDDDMSPAFVVKHSDLYRLPDPRPALTVSLQQQVPGIVQGRLAFYTSQVMLNSEPTMQVHAGLIQPFDAQERPSRIHIHRCRQAAKLRKRFVPLYSHVNGSQDPHTKPPALAIAVPIHDFVMMEHILLTGPWENFSTDEATLDAALAHGITMSSPAVVCPVVRPPPIPIPLRYSRSAATRISMMVTRRPNRRPASPDQDRSIPALIGLDTLSDVTLVPDHEIHSPLGHVAYQFRSSSHEYVDDTAIVGRSASDVANQLLCCDLPGCTSRRWPNHRFCGKTHARMSTQWIYRIQSAVMASGWMLAVFGIAPIIYAYVCAAIFLAQQLGYSPI